MRVLVTGHDGYIGAVMVHVLRTEGHEVTGLDTGYFEGCVLEPDHAPVATVRKDIRDLVERDLDGFDAVIHLAALSNDPLGAVRDDWTYDINHGASVRLARLARDAGVRRFLFSSSCSIYGAAGDDILDEDAPFKPLTAYAISKVRTEEDLSALADRGFSPVFMRNATAYGVSPKFRADLVLNNLACWAYTTGMIRIMSDGTPWRPLVHVEDIARAFVAALVAPRDAIHNTAFNVGQDGENYRVRELAALIQEVIPGSRIFFAEGGGPDPRSYRVDFGRIARTLPEFRPRWNARTGVEELHAAFRRVGLGASDFPGRKYIRLDQLQHLIEAARLDSTLRWSRPSS